MAIVNAGPANPADADDPPPPDPPADGDANTSGAKKLGPPDEAEPPVPAYATGVLLVYPPALGPEGIKPRTANGFNAVVVVVPGLAEDVSNDVNTVAGDAGLLWAATLMPPVASTLTANAAVITVFFPTVGVERCLDILPSAHSLDPDRRGDHAVPHRESGALNRPTTNWFATTAT